MPNFPIGCRVINQIQISTERPEIRKVSADFNSFLQLLAFRTAGKVPEIDQLLDGRDFFLRGVVHFIKSDSYINKLYREMGPM